MKIIVKPCHEVSRDDEGALITHVEHVQIESDDGRCLGSRLFESQYDCTLFVDGLRQGMLHAGVTDPAVVYETDNPSTTAPNNVQQAEVYSDGTVFWIVADSHRGGRHQLRVDAVHNLRTMAAVDATFHDDASWQLMELSCLDEDEVYAHYEADAHLVRVYKWVEPERAEA